MLRVYTVALLWAYSDCSGHRLRMPVPRDQQSNACRQRRQRLHEKRSSFQSALKALSNVLEVVNPISSFAGMQTPMGHRAQSRLHPNDFGIMTRSTDGIRIMMVTNSTLKTEQTPGASRTDIEYIVANDGEKERLSRRQAAAGRSIEGTNSTSWTRLADMLNEDNFAMIFKEMAPYLAMLRGATAVIHIPSFLIFGEKRRFDTIMDEIGIIHMLGVKIILVVGVREKLEERLAERGLISEWRDGIRITDADTLQLLKETSGSARFAVEASLARGLSGRPGRSGASVVSGNVFYSAKPVGVRNGVDHKFTGEVRRVNKEVVNPRLDQGDIVMITTVGLSGSGEAFSVDGESLAAVFAASLGTSKLLYLVGEGIGLTDTRWGTPIQSLGMNQASALLARWGVSPDFYNSAETEGAISTARYLAKCVRALLGGVKRAHIIDAVPGALLKELYTRDGSGILINQDLYEGIRPAEPSDIRDIEDLIKPLEQEGILMKRSRESLEDSLSAFSVMIRDGTCVACGMVKKYGDDSAEVSCLAVSPGYRGGGRGDKMLCYLERQALNLGANIIFVLSTRTMQWFEERGFKEVSPVKLPAGRAYDVQRGSKVYLKELGSESDVREEEALWDVNAKEV